MLRTIPGTQAAFENAIQPLFPNPELAGVVIRPMTSPDGLPFTVADLVEPADLERLVLIPWLKDRCATPRKG
ncbi:MAG TPA: hypothetical protein VGK74_27810 [Symbiobacteriaceae bacterium]|jgi:hypothetical protein